MVNVHKPRSGVNYIDGVLTDGWAWDFSPIVYGFPNTPQQAPTPTAGFMPLNDQQRAVADFAFTSMSNFIRTSFFNGGTSGTINLAQATHFDSDNNGSAEFSVGTGAGFSPTDNLVARSIAGDVWLTPGRYDSPFAGTNAFKAIFHEIGHAMGLKHPNDTTGGMFEMPSGLDGLAFTLMSERDYPNDDPNDGLGTSSGNFPQSYMMYDIAALQYLYGANFSLNATDNTTYKPIPNQSDGNFLVNGTAEPFRSIGGNVIFRTVWDPGGNDTYDFSLYTTSVTASLVPGEWTHLGVQQLAVLEDGQRPPGSIANALLYNGDLRSLIENAIGGSAGDTITGNQGSNTLTGGGGVDTLNGLDGADTLEGGIGDDKLFGGFGQDFLRGGPGADELWGGPDIHDTATYDESSSGVEVELFLGKGGGGSSGIDELHEIEDLTGSSFGDRLGGDDGVNNLYGIGGNDTLRGHGGHDVLKGGGGDDTIEGGPGADSLYGDEDTDTATYASASAGVTADLGAEGNNAGDAAGDTFDLIENLTGSAHNDVLRGNAGRNVLVGGDGSDAFDGRAGADALYGGLGDDHYYLTDYYNVGGIEGYDSVNEAANEGIDTVYVGAQPSMTQGTITSYTLGSNVERGVVTGDQPFEIIGGAAGDTLVGNAGANTLMGFGGDDFLDGLEGFDTLRGGDGDDFIFGRDGGGMLYGDAGNDRVDGGIQNDTIYGGSGNDELRVGHGDNVAYGEADSDFLLGADGLDRLYGGAGNDTLRGENGNDTLDGGAGADVMRGGANNDVFYVDNAGDLVEDFEGGLDRVFTSASYTLTAGASIETFTTISNAATTAINLTGNETAQAIVGNGGANIINGAAGADTMQGLGGNDWYYVDTAGDRAVEAAGGGSDRVLTAVSFALEANSEIELLRTNSDLGAGAINLTGNSFANHLLGNAGANQLNGRTGADIMQGLGGNDWYYIDNVGDRAVEAAGKGSDRALTSASFTLEAGSEVELLMTTDAAATTAINLTGNAFANQFYGNAGSNRLDGRAGADIMSGLGGNDFFYVDHASDRAVEATGQGSDRVLASMSFALEAGSEIETFVTANNAGTTAMNLTGNAFANLIVGNAGQNIVNGGLGNDTLFGLGGPDHFLFNTALGATNVDAVRDFDVAADFIRLENAVFTTLAAGGLPGTAFRVGASAADADDRIIYNSATGAVIYDSNGNAAGGATQFATLSAGLALSSADFIVV